MAVSASSPSPWRNQRDNLLEQLDLYVNSANRIIGEAEEELRHPRPRPPPPAPPPRISSVPFYKPHPPPISPSASSSGTFSRSNWSYSSLNSSARRKQFRRNFESESSLSALNLDGGGRKIEVYAPVVEEDPSKVLDMSEIEKMTGDLLRGLDSIEEKAPPPPPRVPAMPKNLPSEPPSRHFRQLKFLPGDSRSFRSPNLSFESPQDFRRPLRREPSSTSAASEIEDSFLEEFCDPGIVSPSWQYLRRVRSCDSLSDFEPKLNESALMTRFWTSEESVADKGSRAIMSKYLDSPSTSPDVSNMYRNGGTLNILDKQLVLALKRIRQERDQLTTPKVEKSPKTEKRIVLNEDIFAEFEAEFTATLTRPKRKFSVVPPAPKNLTSTPLYVPPRTKVPKKDSLELFQTSADDGMPKKPQIKVRRSQSSTSAPKAKPRKERTSSVDDFKSTSAEQSKMPLSRRESNVALRAQFFADLINPPVPKSNGVIHDSTREVSREEINNVENLHKIEKVNIEQSKHPLLISYRSALQKNVAVLQSNPDLSEIISHVRQNSDQRKSLVLSTSSEKAGTPSNSRPLEKLRVDETQVEINNNSGQVRRENLKNTPSLADSIAHFSGNIDAYSEVMEKSLESLESFCHNLKLEPISASFDADLANLSPMKKPRAPVEAADSEDCLSTSSGAASTVTSETATCDTASSGSETTSKKHFLGDAGRGSQDEAVSLERSGSGRGTNKSIDILLQKSTGHVADLSPIRPSKALKAAEKSRQLPRPEEVRPASPDLALYNLNKSEQILNNLVRSSTDPQVAQLLSSSSTVKSSASDSSAASSSATSSKSTPVEDVCPCGKPISIKSSDKKKSSEFCKKCSSSKAMRFLYACTNFTSKTNSLPNLKKEDGVRRRPNESPAGNVGAKCPKMGGQIEGQKESGAIMSSNGHQMAKPARCNSATDIHEAEAVQALEWLRQTGFPQYVQMYEDNCFPLDMSTVYKDHPHLDADEIQSLLRRLNTLNKCARMKSDAFVKAMLHSSDEDLALSDNWQFHRPSRRWSRIVPPNLTELPLITKQHVDNGSYMCSQQQEAYSSHDSVFLDSEAAQASPDSDSHTHSGIGGNNALSASDERIQPSRSPTPSSQQSKLRRSGSERVRDAIIRKVDSFRRRRREARSRSPKTQKIVKAWEPGDHLIATRDNQSPKFLSPKGKRRECYDNQALTADQDCETHSLNLEPDYLPLATEVNGVLQENRRDSGVGSSLTRTSVGSVIGQHQALLATSWHCYPGPPSHPTLLCPDRPIPLSQLTACQHMILRKHALLRLTALMERYSPPYKTGWAWSVPKFIKKMTTPNYKDKVTFGVPLGMHVQRTGYPLPPSIQTAMQFVSSVAPRCGGIFRKPGVRSRIEKLRQLHETHMLDARPLTYESQQCYDVADMVKQYFRELPEGGLLTNKFSQTFLYIFMHIPEEHRLEALQSAVLILPDENREVLETLLCFLDEIAQGSQQNGMTASNLALCFAPSVFQLAQATSPKRKRTDKEQQWTGEREICENRAGNECLCKMIDWHKELFSASVQILQSARLAIEEPTDLQMYLCNDNHPVYKLYLDSCLHWLLHEVRLNKGWTQVSHPELEIAYKKIDDEYHYVRLWKCSVLAEAPPVEVLTRILRERHLWDDCLIKYRVVRRIDANTEVCAFVRAEMGPHASREFLQMRTWRTDITSKSTCALIEVSVSDQDWSGFGSGYCHVSSVYPSWVRAQVLASRYLVQPGGAGKSKVTHLVRIDTRGRSAEWYNRSAGNIHAHHLLRMAQSFKSGAASSGIGLPSTGHSEKETKL